MNNSAILGLVAALGLGSALILPIATDESSSTAPSVSPQIVTAAPQGPGDELRPRSEGFWP